MDNIKKPLLNVLKGSGYYFAEVDSSVVENDNNTVDIIYDINLVCRVCSVPIC